MSATPDNELCETYSNKLKEEKDEEREYGRDNHTSVSDRAKDAHSSGSIVMDDKGNCYYRSFEKVIEIKRLRKIPEFPGVETVSANDVSTNNCKSPGIIKEGVKLASKRSECSFKTPLQKDKVKSISDSRTEPACLPTHKSKTPYACSVCGKGFTSKKDFSDHQNRNLECKQHPCSECDMSFTAKEDLLSHERNRHSDIKPHMCSECDYCCKDMSQLRRHMRSHTGERLHKCSQCTYSSNDKFKLKLHMRVHTGEKPYKCDICNHRFTQSNSLKNHRLIHSYKKPILKCHLCAFSCGQDVDLKQHIQELHTSEHPIPCIRCGKELPDRYSHNMHMKAHDGEKIFRCQYCVYASISKDEIDLHAITHFDVKPFACGICERSFRRKPLLTHHMKIYHEPNYVPSPPLEKIHKCPNCGKMFAHLGNLKRHIEFHDSIPKELEEREVLKTVTNSNSLQKLYHNNAYTEQQNEDVNDSEAGEYDESGEITHLIDIKEEKIEIMDIAQTAQERIVNIKDEYNQNSLIETWDVESEDEYIVKEFLSDDDEKEEQENKKLKITKSVQNFAAINRLTSKDIQKNVKKESHRLILDNIDFEIKVEEGDEECEETTLLEVIENGEKVELVEIFDDYEY